MMEPSPQPSPRGGATALLLAALAAAGPACHPEVEVVARHGGDADGDADAHDGGDADPDSVTPAVGMAAGEAHACLWRSGEAFCWGRNGDGEVGDGTRDARTTPVRVALLADVAGMTAGGYPGGTPTGHTCAWLDDGSAFCWGAGDAGQVGDGAERDRLLPVAVELPAVAGMAAGGDHSCAWSEDGAAWCWGGNEHGQLGDGSTVGRPSPAPVPGLEAVAGMAAALWYTCAWLRDGSALCWGRRLGEAGSPTEPRPTPVPGLDRVADIAAGEGHCCAVGADGVLRCWGDNHFGQLGDGSTVSRPWLAEVEVRDVAGASAGDLSTCARTGAGDLHCWGCMVPDPVGGCHERPFEAVGLPAIAGVEVGAEFGCAWTAAGAAFCWGSNIYGQLGNGSLGGSTVPTPVSL